MSYAAAYDAVAGEIPIYGGTLLAAAPEIKERAFDIRFGAGQPLCVCCAGGPFFLDGRGRIDRRSPLVITREEMRRLFLAVCGQSVFSHEEEIKRGYVLLNGRIRVGVCAAAVTEDGRIKSVKDVSSLVFRIPREAIGCADRLFSEGIDFSRGVLIAGEPSAGKTTLLRDLARSLSCGRHGRYGRVAVLDERAEISAGFDLGPCADVLIGYPKALALDIAVRTLSPEYIACDELSGGELEIIGRAAQSGAGLIATVHAGRDEALSRPLCRRLLKTGAFGTVVSLYGRERPAEIYKITEVDRDEAYGRNAFAFKRGGAWT